LEMRDTAGQRNGYGFERVKGLTGTKLQAGLL